MSTVYSVCNEKTKLLVQGITGVQGAFHASQCLEYGTQVVGGVTPGKGGQKTTEGLPIFNTMRDAVLSTEANATMIFVPAPFVEDSIYEALDQDSIKLIVCITDGVPAETMIRIRSALDSCKQKDKIFIGPNCPGIINPAAKCKIGIMPGYIHSQGAKSSRIGIVSRSGTLTYEAVDQTTKIGLGQSMCLGIGGDPVHGIGFVSVIKMFLDDPDTDGILLIGEIGGSEEEDAAKFALDYHIKKPMAGFIAGSTAPAGKRMGHAGAIISGGKGDAQSKMAFLSECGFKIALTPGMIGKAMKEALDKFAY